MMSRCALRNLYFCIHTIWRQNLCTVIFQTHNFDKVAWQKWTEKMHFGKNTQYTSQAPFIQLNFSPAVYDVQRRIRREREKERGRETCLNVYIALRSVHSKYQAIVGAQPSLQLQKSPALWVGLSTDQNLAGKVGRKLVWCLMHENYENNFNHTTAES